VLCALCRKRRPTIAQAIGHAPISIFWVHHGPNNNVLCGLKIIGNLQYRHHAALCIGTTLLPTTGAVLVNLAQSAIRLRRFSNRSLR